MSVHSTAPTATLVVSKIAFSVKTVGEWNCATKSIKESQKRFLTAYQSSITDVFGPGWETKWRTTPEFPSRLREAEREMKRLCTGAGMSVSVFTRYQTAARKQCFLGVPFNFGTTLSLEDIRQAQELAEGGTGRNRQENLRQALKTVREQKNIRKAADKVAKVATVLPLPEPEVHPEDFLEDQVLPQLESYLKRIEEQFGRECVLEILERMTALHRDDSSGTDGADPAAG